MVTRALAEDFMTLAEIATVKGTTVEALKKWMRRYPERIDARFVGNVIVARLSSFETYKRVYR